MTDERGTIADLVLHPVRLRILQAVAGRQLTTAQLRERLPDVTTATLYRHITTLLEADVLTVVAERKVRGAVERTLALGGTSAVVDRDGADALGPDQLRQAFLTLLASVTEAVDDHLDQAADLTELFGFATTPLHLDVDEAATLQEELAELLGRYREPGPGRREVMLTTVLVPSPEPAEPTA